MTTQVILFTKVPAPGWGKSRLARDLSPEVVERISWDLVRRVYRRIQKTPHCIYYMGDRSRLQEFDCPLYEQQGETFAKRMLHAFERELKRADAVVLLGSDFAQLPEDLLEQAFSQLETHDVVVAPTRDGGYGLIGLRALQDLFTPLSYEGGSVFEALVQLIQQLGLSYALLEPLQDLDTLEDLVCYETGAHSCQRIGRGEYNINFLLNASKRVFRINTRSQLGLGERQIEYEFDSLQALQESGVTPKVYEYKLRSDLLPLGTLQMEYIEGRPLCYETDLPLAAQLLASVHNHPVQGAHWIRAERPFRLMYEEFENLYGQYARWEGRQEAVCQTLERFLQQVRRSGLDEEVQRPCILNTELNNENFLIGKQSRIIDWEKPILGDCEQDLAHFLVPTTTNWKTDVILSEEQIEAFLQEYQKYRAFSRRLLRKYMMFNVVRGTTWCSMAQVEYAEKRGAGNPETEEKIYKFLSPEFLSMLESRFIYACEE